MDSSQWAAVAATASAIPAAVALVALLSAQRAERKRREPHLVGVAFAPEDLLDPSTMKITNIGGGAAVRAGVAGLHRGQQYSLPVERVWTARFASTTMVARRPIPSARPSLGPLLYAGGAIAYG